MVQDLQAHEQDGPSEALAMLGSLAPQMTGVMATARCDSSERVRLAARSALHLLKSPSEGYAGSLRGSR